MKPINQSGWGRGMAAGLAMLAQAAAAQPAMTPGAQAPLSDVQTSQSPDPADRLAANLVILSQNPRDVTALTEAGLSAIAVGDGDAALSFLARAEDISPGNGRIKAGIGSALLLKQKPSEALRLFAEAVALGMPEQQVAGDRGLAHDLLGDPKRAQRDYALALRAGGDDDLLVRYALSLGISGDDQRAMELLDPLLRQKNRSAWRARAFVLAMNGDVPAARDVANTVMPGGSGASMAPFLQRLATLGSAERALAVNYGIMPSDGSTMAFASAGDIYRPSGSGGASDGLIPAGEPLGPRPSAPAPPSPSVAKGIAASDQPTRTRAEPLRRPSDSAPPRAAAQAGSVQVASVEKPPQAAILAANNPEIARNTVPVASQTANVVNGDVPPPPRFEVSDPPATAGQGREAGPMDRPAEASSAVPAAAAEAATGLASIVAGLEVEPESTAGPLPTASEMKAARIAAQRKAVADAKAEAEAKAAREAKEAEQRAAAKNPARIWVQIATGANDAGIPGTWKKMKEKSPTVFKGQNASFVPFKATNRVLVGPFKSQAEARAMVSAMAKAGLQGSTFTSDPGQVVTKVSGK